MIVVELVKDETDQCLSCGKPAVIEVRTSTYPQLVHSSKYCHECGYILYYALKRALP